MIRVSENIRDTRTLITRETGLSPISGPGLKFVIERHTQNSLHVKIWRIRDFIKADTEIRARRL